MMDLDFGGYRSRSGGGWTSLLGLLESLPFEFSKQLERCKEVPLVPGFGFVRGIQGIFAF